MNKFALSVFISFSLFGCAHVISEEARKQVDTNITFGEVKLNPDAFIGRKIMVGGKIAGVRNSNEGGLMEVVQFTLDDSGFPIEVSKSAGRFIATSPDFLDPLIYKIDRLITMTGEIKGKRTGAIDSMTYVYPMISIQEIFAWKFDENERGVDYPSPSFYNNYNPYDFSHDVPLWFRPSGPVIRP